MTKVTARFVLRVTAPAFDRWVSGSTPSNASEGSSCASRTGGVNRTSSSRSRGGWSRTRRFVDARTSSPSRWNANAAFTRWLEQTAELRRQRALLARVARRWRDRLVVSAFVTSLKATRVTSTWTARRRRRKSRSKMASPAPRARVRPLVRLVPRHATRDAGGGARGGTVAERGARARVVAPAKRRKALRKWRGGGANGRFFRARRVADERGGATTPPTPPGAGRRPVAPTRRCVPRSTVGSKRRERELELDRRRRRSRSAGGERRRRARSISGAPSAPSRRPRAACSRAGRRWASRSGRWLRGSFVGRRRRRSGSL